MEKKAKEKPQQHSSLCIMHYALCIMHRADTHKTKHKKKTLLGTHEQLLHQQLLHLLAPESCSSIDSLSNKESIFSWRSLASYFVVSINNPLKSTLYYPLHRINKAQP
jgi:hypothetical protein